MICLHEKKNVEGCPVAKRNRYREMENLMTKIIIADALVFVLYLVCAGMGWAVFKVITGIIAIVASLLALAWLYITGEFTRRRSLWMVTGFIGIVLCILVSLLLNYPAPAIPELIQPNSVG
jgi:RsiW-degrading membrane proteinase PrsW (M82 family)